MPPDLPCLEAPLTYLRADAAQAEYRVYPASSGLPNVRPAVEQHTVRIRDGRAVAGEFDLDLHGFAFARHATSFTDFYDPAAVQARYYPEVAAYLRERLRASRVLVFDHNTRSAVRAARGELGVREPVDGVHNDYTERSGPKRAREILDSAGCARLIGRRCAFVNLWRPIVGPVQDVPLAVCDARTLSPEDIVDTPILHFTEADLASPSHRGEIQSMRYSPAQRWYWFSDMRPDEVLLLKCYDAPAAGRARFAAHTGFRNPACPADCVPRESIEARTLAVY